MVRLGLAVVGLIGLAASTMLADAKPAESLSTITGQLNVDKTGYDLKHVTVLEVLRSDNALVGVKRQCIVVVASLEALNKADVEAVRKQTGGVHTPHIEISFTRRGKPIAFRGVAHNSTFGGPIEDKSDLKTEFKVVNDRLHGTAKYNNPEYWYDFDFRFDIAVPKGLNTAKLAAGPGTVDQDREDLVFPAPGSVPNTASVPACVNGQCNLNLFDVLGADCSPSSREAGSYAIVGTPQGTIRINSRTGESCLLVIPSDGKPAHWQSIQEPECGPNTAPVPIHFGPAATSPQGPRVGN